MASSHLVPVRLGKHRLEQQHHLALLAARHHHHLEAEEWGRQCSQRLVPPLHSVVPWGQGLAARHLGAGVPARQRLHSVLLQQREARHLAATMVARCLEEQAQEEWDSGPLLLSSLWEASVQGLVEVLERVVVVDLAREAGAPSAAHPLVAVPEDLVALPEDLVGLLAAHPLVGLQEINGRSTVDDSGRRHVPASKDMFHHHSMISP